MRKGRDGEKNGGKKRGGEKKREKTDDYSGHYVIASSRPPERRPLERRTLVPILQYSTTVVLSIITSYHALQNLHFAKRFRIPLYPRLLCFLLIHMN